MSLLKAINLLSDPQRWTKGSNAKDVDGDNVIPGSPNAVCWCLGGAIAHCGNNAEQIRNDKGYVEIALCDMGRYPSIPIFNDDHRVSYFDVMDVLFRAYFLQVIYEDHSTVLCYFCKREVPRIDTVVKGSPTKPFFGCKTHHGCDRDDLWFVAVSAISLVKSIKEKYDLP